MEQVGKEIAAKSKILVRWSKAFEKSVFGPPEPMTVVGRFNPPDLSNLIWTSVHLVNPPKLN